MTSELTSFIIGAGWVALLGIGVIGFSIWFDVWTKVHYRIWEQYDQDDEGTKEGKAHP